MRLADFITSSTEAILEEWVAFARTSGPAGRTMSPTQLRDHGREMLEAIARDLRTPQSDAEEREKSTGKVADDPKDPDTAAEAHGAGRAVSGFTLVEMVSEYRALRASVTRLWVRECGRLEESDLADLIRFNEAIDQSLAESTEKFTEDLDRSKEMFLAILGHDLRNPISAITMSSQFLRELDETRQPQFDLAGTILNSARRMNRMVGDLLDFTRGRLGSGLSVSRSPTDLGRVAEDAVGEIEAAHPGRRVHLQRDGALIGNWDSGRLAQLFTNLLTNAIEYGTAEVPVDVKLFGRPGEVEFVVHNAGVPIPPQQLHGLFRPFKRIDADRGRRALDNLGLGLYITERIVAAHAGTIAVTSDATGTAFTVRLPLDEPIEQRTS
jgi:signal transduction histidine kinase